MSGYHDIQSALLYIVCGSTVVWEFNATKPNEKWVTDVTEFKVPETGRKLYLSVILDLYDRFPVAYVISGRNDNKLVFDTYDKALKDNLDARPIFHSDRGFHISALTASAKGRKSGSARSKSTIFRVGQRLRMSISDFLSFLTAFRWGLPPL